MSPAGKNIDKTVSPLKQKPVQFKYKMSKDIPKTSLSPKKIGNSTKVIVCGTGHNLVLARTEHPSKNGEDGYTYDAKKMLIEDVEKAANLGVINVSFFFSPLPNLYLIIKIFHCYRYSHRSLTGEKIKALTLSLFRQAVTIHNSLFLNLTNPKRTTKLTEKI